MASRLSLAPPLLVGVLAVAPGCAAKTTADLMQAERVLLDARAAGAEQAAPYQLTLAQAYLDKAREEWARSQYQDADHLAAAARAHAEEAERLAIQEATMGSGAQEIVPEEVAPTPEPPTEPPADEPADDELMDIIQDEATPGETPADEADPRRPSMLGEEKIDESQFEEEE